jgi:hypothetical protein
MQKEISKKTLPDRACSFHPNGCPELAHSEDAREAIEELLVKGAHIIETFRKYANRASPLMPKSEAWLAEVRKYVSLGTVRVTVGPTPPSSPK